MKKTLIAAALLLVAAGCVEEGDYATFLISEDNPETRVSELTLSFDGAVEAGTRSILGDEADGKCSGGVVAVYDAATGLLDSEWEVPDFSGSLSMRLPSSGKKNIYVTGNLWYIDGTGAALRPSFPKKESDVASMVYRMDGSKTSSGRTETFSEASSYGIPVVGTLAGVDPACSTSVSVSLRRLFAKVVLTVDHSGLDGGGDVGRFENVDVYLRQANVKLILFGEESCASSVSDTAELSDYDPSMTNGHALTYTFYVPENRHSSYPTYIEFKGWVDASAGGYGGTVCYRFHIGSGSDHDVEGNQVYAVTLGFKAGSLFDPQWSVTTGDDWSDSRKLCLAKDSSGSSKLSSDSIIAVRKSRPANCWLYYSRQGSGTNEASVLSACNGSFEPSDLTESAWWCEAPELESNGISMSASGGKLTFSVTDASKFVPGRKIPLKLHLYPGDSVTEAELTTYDDIEVSVSDGLSLTDEFYIGMCREISVSGLAGSTVSYWNAYGVDRLSFKASNSVDAEWIHNSRSATQNFRVGETLKLYAFASSIGMQFLLRMASDDTFNDGDLIYNDYAISSPLHTKGSSDNVYIPFDGRSVTIPFSYLDDDGNVIAKERFDAAVYSQVLQPKILWPSTIDQAYPQFIGDDDTGVYLRSMYVDGEFIGERTLSLGGYLCQVSYGPSGSNMVYGPVSANLYVRAPYWAASFCDLETVYYDTQSSSKITASGVARVYDDVAFTAECSGNVTSGVSLSTSALDADRTQVSWKFSDEGRTPDGLAPVGPQTVSLKFVHSRTNETYTLSSTFNVTHIVTLRPFVLFTLNASTAQVVATTAKNAWLLSRYCSKESGVPKITGFLGLSGASFNQYVTMKYRNATRKGGSTEAVYRGSCIMSGKYQYEDFDSSCYDKGYKWTSARISKFASYGAAALTYLGFCGPGTSYTPLATPLASSYVGGSSYISLRVSSSTLGYAILP